MYGPYLDPESKKLKIIYETTGTSKLAEHMVILIAMLRNFYTCDNGTA